MGIFVCLSVVTYQTNLQPSRAPVLLQLAANAENHNRQHSLELYRRAVEAEPGRDQYHYLLGSALMRALPNASNAATRERLLSDAEYSLEKALELDPWNSYYCVQLGRLQAGRAQLFSEEERRSVLQQAIPWYEKAAKLSPNLGIIYQELGSLRFQLGDFAAARKQFEISISLDPRNAETYIRMARLETQAGNLEEALRAYDRAIQLRPRNAEALGGRGFVLASLGQYPKAIEAYDKALAINSHDSAALKNLALLYGRIGDFKKALYYAQMALRELPQQEQPDYEKAIESFQQRLAEQARPN
jgi:tetratricopeptide (TPR) repeat protein